eukprot:TRINITY_DN9756_c0_g1_i1.p1 TRINITY_DN9756_c0_g1~~TRINITY_DN9756_c0_g1_i1.p1  ORF type:complete len:701 (+),score=194.03 TRINITY_DN9756_c0_g1_i1:231-2333(+)
MKAGDEWRRVPPTVAGSKEVSSLVDPDSPLFYALRVVCNHVKDGKRNVASKVCKGSIKGGNDGMGLLRAAGVQKEGDDWKFAGKGTESPVASSITTNNVTYELGDCMHVGRVVVIRAARKTNGKDPEQVLVRLHCYTPQYYYNEINTLLALTGHSFVCRLYEVTCLGGIPATVVSHERGTSLAKLSSCDDSNELLLLIESLLNAFNELEKSSLCNWNLTADHVLFTKAKGITLLKMGETRACSAGEKAPTPLNGSSRSSIRSVSSDLTEEEGWACNTYALRLCLARVKELTTGVGTNVRSAVTLFTSAVESAAGTPLQVLNMQPAPAAKRFTVNDVITIWNKFKWEKKGETSPTSSHGSASPNRISRRIMSMQQEASSQEAERAKQVNLLKQRRQSAPRVTQEETSLDNGWLQRQADEEERRRLEFLKEIEEQERNNQKPKPGKEKRKSSKVSKEVEELRSVLKKNRTSVTTNEGDILEGEEAAGDWTVQQQDEEQRRRQEFLQEIERNEAREKLNTVRKQTKQEGKTERAASTENSESLENFLTKQGKEEEKRRQQFIEEIEAQDKLKEVLKKSADKKRYSKESPRVSSSSSWMQQQHDEEQRRREAFLQEIEKEEAPTSSPTTNSKHTSTTRKESKEVAALRDAIKKNRTGSDTKGEIRLEGTEGESPWMKNQKLEEEKRRAQFLKEIEDAETAKRKN